MSARKRLALLVAVVAVGLLGAGIAYASIPGPDGVVHGCYKTSNPGQGALIVVDSAATCPSGFAGLNWNQSGPQGPQGSPGISGYQYVIHHYTGPFPTGSQNFSVACPAGKYVIWSGGVSDRERSAERGCHIHACDRSGGTAFCGYVN